jgi:hypothetical protein
LLGIGDILGRTVCHILMILIDKNNKNIWANIDLGELQGWYLPPPLERPDQTSKKSGKGWSFYYVGKRPRQTGC